MTQTVDPRIVVVAKSFVKGLRDTDANGVARAVNGASAELIKQARTASRTTDNGWLTPAMQQGLHGAAMALANHVAQRGGGGLVFFTIFSDEEEGEAELVADNRITGRRVMVSVRREDDRVQIVKATVENVERTGWMKKPYELSEVAMWLLRNDA